MCILVFSSLFEIHPACLRRMSTYRKDAPSSFVQLQQVGVIIFGVIVSHQVQLTILCQQGKPVYLAITDCEQVCSSTAAAIIFFLLSL